MVFMRRGAPCPVTVNKSKSVCVLFYLGSFRYVTRAKRFIQRLCHCLMRDGAGVNVKTVCQMYIVRQGWEDPLIGQSPPDPSADVSQTVQMWTTDKDGHYIEGDTVNVGDSITGNYLNGEDVQISYGGGHYYGIPVGAGKTTIYLTTRKWNPNHEVGYEIYAYGELPSGCPAP